MWVSCNKQPTFSLNNLLAAIQPARNWRVTRLPIPVFNAQKLFTAQELPNVLECLLANPGHPGCGDFHDLGPEGFWKVHFCKEDFWVEIESVVIKKPSDGKSPRLGFDEHLVKDVRSLEGARHTYAVLGTFFMEEKHRLKHVNIKLGQDTPGKIHKNLKIQIRCKPLYVLSLPYDEMSPYFPMYTVYTCIHSHKNLTWKTSTSHIPNKQRSSLMQ